MSAIQIQRDIKRIQHHDQVGFIPGIKSLVQRNKVTAAAAALLQSCWTLCDPIDGSPPGSPHPWNSPGKNTGVGCHFLLQCMKVKSESEVAQSVWLLATPWTGAYQTLPSNKVSYTLLIKNKNYTITPVDSRKGIWKHFNFGTFLVAQG